MSLTRSSVAALAGELFGVTIMTAVSPASLVTGGETASTSGREEMLSFTCSAAVLGSPPPLASTTIVNGPLWPGPKPADTRS